MFGRIGYAIGNACKGRRSEESWPVFNVFPTKHSTMNETLVRCNFVLNHPNDVTHTVLVRGFVVVLFSYH